MTPKRSPETISRETLDRVRRIETRLSRFLQQNGFDVQSQKPRWLGGDSDCSVMELPDAKASIRDILDAIPAGYSGDVDLKIGNDYLGTIYYEPGK